MTEKKDVLDRYRLQKRLALGGSAEVWHAHDRKLNRPVAVKRLHAHLLPDPASRRRLGAEARAAARLKHQNIVEVYAVDTKGEMPALVMELVDGESLATRLDRDGPLPAGDAVRIAADMADALYHAHRLGIIHRDVKPGNVLLGRDGSTRLVDFGIARSLAEAAERVTMAGTVIGTPRYMAPEQLTDGSIGPRTDLFGLGLLLHEMLTGRLPYTATAPVALMQEQAAGAPAIRDVDPALAALIAACLAPDPELRPVHAGAVAAGLRAWLAGDPAPALAVAAGEPPPAATASSDTSAITQPMAVVPPPAPAAEAPLPVAPASTGGRPGPAPHRRAPIRPLSVAAALAAVGLVALLAVAFLDPSQPAAATPTATASTPAATPTPPPWLAGLVEAYRDACGPDGADEVEAELATLTEEDARDRVEELIDGCDDKKGKGNRGGNGGGGGGGD